MKKQTKKRKKNSLLVLPLLLVAGLLLPIGAFAQDGLFDRGLSDEAYYGFGGSGLLRDGDRGSTEATFAHQTFGNDYEGTFTHQTFGMNHEGNFTHQTFGNDTPVGSGLLILLSAGMGYAAMKRKKQNKKNQQNKRNQIN